MNRITTALLAALEALIVVAISVGIALVPLTVLWAAHFGLAVEWFVFWRAAVDVWLLGNGVDLLVQLDPAVAVALGLAGAEAPFHLTLAPMAFALVAVLFGVRTGRRAAETPHRWVGVAAAVLSYAAVTALVTVSALGPVVSPTLWQGLLFPPLIYAGGVLLGSELGARDGHRASGLTGTALLDPVTRSIRERYLDLPWSARAAILGALRGGTATVAGILALSAVTVTVLIGLNYTTIIALYEAVQAGILGGATLTLVQLAVIPNLVIWAAAWFVGPGIAVGMGSNISPAGTVLGPIPGLPLFGALPQGSLEYGFLGLLVPVLCSFVFAVLTRQRMNRVGLTGPSRLVQVLTGLGMGLVAGLLLGLLAWWSGGAIGPGRLTEVGPDPVLVGALVAAEVGVAAVLGMLVGDQVRVTLPARRPRSARRPREPRTPRSAREPRARRPRPAATPAAGVAPTATATTATAARGDRGTRRERFARFLRAEGDDGPDSADGPASGPTPPKR